MSSRTRSDVKWLVNEAAALAGELGRIDQELARLRARRESVQAARDACAKTLACIVESKAIPALPVVRAHRSYGGRGKLRQFMLDVLRQAPDRTLSTAELALLAIEHFGLEFSTSKALYHFRINSIARALHKLRAEGVVERISLPERAGPVLGHWRWKCETLSIDAISVRPTTDKASGATHQGKES